MKQLSFADVVDLMCNRFEPGTEAELIANFRRAVSTQTTAHVVKVFNEEFAENGETLTCVGSMCAMSKEGQYVLATS